MLSGSFVQVHFFIEILILALASVAWWIKFYTLHVLLMLGGYLMQNFVGQDLSFFAVEVPVVNKLHNVPRAAPIQSFGMEHRAVGVEVRQVLRRLLTDSNHDQRNRKVARSDYSVSGGIQVTHFSASYYNESGILQLRASLLEGLKVGLCVLNGEFDDFRHDGRAVESHSFESLFVVRDDLVDALRDEGFEDIAVEGEQLRNLDVSGRQRGSEAVAENGPSSVEVLKEADYFFEDLDENVVVPVHRVELPIEVAEVDGDDEVQLAACVHVGEEGALILVLDRTFDYDHTDEQSSLDDLQRDLAFMVDHVHQQILLGRPYVRDSFGLIVLVGPDPQVRRLFCGKLVHLDFDRGPVDFVVREVLNYVAGGDAVPVALALHLDLNEQAVLRDKLSSREVKADLAVTGLVLAGTDLENALGLGGFLGVDFERDGPIVPDLLISGVDKANKLQILRRDILAVCEVVDVVDEELVELDLIQRGCERDDEGLAEDWVQFVGNHLSASDLVVVFFLSSAKHDDQRVAEAESVHFRQVQAGQLNLDVDALLVVVDGLRQVGYFDDFGSVLFDALLLVLEEAEIGCGESVGEGGGRRSVIAHEFE